MDLLWNCYGLAWICLGFLWICDGFAMEMPWSCFGFARVSYGFAMDWLRICFGFAMDLLWLCFGFSRSGQTTQYVADFRHSITEAVRVNKDLEVGGVGAGRIFTESYDVKAEGEEPSNGHPPFL